MLTIFAIFIFHFDGIIDAVNSVFFCILIYKMYTRKILRYFKLHLHLCNLLASISIYWDPKKKRLATLKNGSGRLRQFRLHMFIAVVHNIFLVGSLLLRDVGTFGIAYKMLAIYFTIGYVMCNGCKIVVWFYQDELVKLVNAQLDYEQGLRDLRIIDENGGGGEKSEKILLILGLITGISVPILVFLILMAHPCLPPFIGSIWFVYKDNHCTTWSTGAYFGMGLLNFWMHLDMVLPFVFTMFGLFFMSIALLQDYLQIIRREFPLDFGEKIMMAPLQMYRRLQILENQVNICFQSHYFPLFLGGMTALLIFCMHSCIKLPGKIPMPGFSYFPMVVVNGVVSLLVMNTKAANMQQFSAKMIQDWRNSPKVHRKHWMKKIALSFVPLKIRLGSNFVDQLTPILMLNFTVNQVVSLLLIQSE